MFRLSCNKFKTLNIIKCFTPKFSTPFNKKLFSTNIPNIPDKLNSKNSKEIKTKSSQVLIEKIKTFTSKIHNINKNNDNYTGKFDEFNDYQIFVLSCTLIGGVFGSIVCAKYYSDPLYIIFGGIYGLIMGLLTGMLFGKILILLIICTPGFIYYYFIKK